MATHFTRILGIDPGSRVVGYALINKIGRTKHHPNGIEVLEVGTINADTKLDFVKRIGAIHRALFALLEELKPEVCVVEQAFLGPNVNSALKLGEARGAILSAIGRHQISIFEVSPRSVKKLVTGSGAANKSQVAKAVENLTGFKKQKLSYDATDALAMAIAHGLRQYQI